MVKLDSLFEEKIRIIEVKMAKTTKNPKKKQQGKIRRRDDLQLMKNGVRSPPINNKIIDIFFVDFFLFPASLSLSH